MDTVVGIFDNQDDAEDAVNSLDALDLKPDSIRVMTRNRVERSGGLLESLAGAFGAGDTPIESALIGMGLDREEAEFYEQELGEEGVLVAVRTDDDHAEGVMTAMRGANGMIRE